MIQFEYDPPKAGTRISFVLCDGAFSFSSSYLDVGEWLSQSVAVGGDQKVRGLPQTRENLLVIREIIDHILETGDGVDK